ncbi:hypothetical protein [Nakamurella lactea]|uniref:hypothetical protein n=1 Tax=Nakamurella lactea TaxID=459515 RepID=UPI000417D8C3|nr:hypothetical protein [Nakamurella lactea]
MTQPPTPPPGDQGGYPNPAQPPPTPEQPAGAGYPQPGQQPPPPPPNQQFQAPQGQQFPPPPQNQQFQAPGAPARPAAAFDPASVSKSDWTVLGVGVLMLIFSFFGWYSVSSTLGGGGSLGGWNRWWIIIQLLLLAVLVIKAVQIFTGNLKKEVPGIALVGLGVLIVVLSLIALIENFANSTSETVGAFTVSGGPGFGIWAYLILSIVFTYFLALGAQKEGGKLPFKVPGPAGF